MSDLVNELRQGSLSKDDYRWKAADLIKRLRVENIQMQAALGYAICAEDERHIIPSNPFKCGVCDANKGVHDRIEQLEAALLWIVGCALTEPGLMVDKARAALEERT